MDSNFHSFYNTKCVQIKTDMNKIIILILSLVLVSCEKKDRIEIDNIDGYKVEKKIQK